MDLNQRKLTKSEWDSIEIPCSKEEIEVLNLIINGYHEVNIKINKNESIFSFLKIEYSQKMEDYIYNKYLSEEVNTIIEKYNLTILNNLILNNDVQIKSADKIRLEKNSITNFKSNKIYEYVLLDYINKLLTAKNNNESNKFILNYFTLYKLLKNNIVNINRHILTLCQFIIKNFENELDLLNVIDNAVELIEKNTDLLKYNDMALYEHQKEIFTICNKIICLMSKFRTLI